MAIFLRQLLSSAASRASTPVVRQVVLSAGAAAISLGVAYYISPPTMAHLDFQNQESDDKVALPKHKWLEVKLQENARVSHNTLLLRFTFDPAARLGIDAASFIFTRARIGEGFLRRKRYVIRPYTPISDLDSKGYFDLLVKVYPDGKMSQHFASLKPGDVIEVQGRLEFKYSPNMKRKIGMIAGGTGITPILQVIKAVLKNPEDKTQVSLIFANTTADDILLKEELDRLSASYPTFKVFYTISRPSDNWTGGIGHVSKDMVLENLPGPGEDTLILVCGPPGLMKEVSGEKTKWRNQGELSGILKELGYTKEMVHKF